VRRVEELRRAHARQIAQREAAPLLFLAGRERLGAEPLERREAGLEQPVGLGAPDTKPLDRFAVERQR
jgi:hypothetical protein